MAGDGDGLAEAAGRKDIDLIDICVPNSLHRDIAIAALQAGKMVATEKPLALNAEQGREMVEAAAKSGKKTMVWFNQRRFPPSPWQSR